MVHTNPMQRAEDEPGEAAADCPLKCGTFQENHTFYVVCKRKHIHRAMVQDLVASVETLQVAGLRGGIAAYIDKAHGLGAEKIVV